MKKTFSFAVLAYLVPTFILGYFWHLTWFHEAYQALQIYRADVIIPLGLSSMFVQALIFAWSYPKLFSTDRAVWVKSAVKAFFVFGLLSWSFTTLAVSAKNVMTSVPDYILLETAWTAIQFLVAAPLMALAWRNKQ